MVSAPADLGQLNTLKVSAQAERLVTVTCVEELVAALSDIPADSPVHILGGGSNVILHDTLPGTTILIAIKERTVLSQLGDAVSVRGGAGENWHEWVLWCHHNAFHGLANLALIPGSVGAAPIQNIGAYG
ncbi:FAD-binding protein, partial [Luminiphilus sp.]|nr:FAD-binding protein [Luminiphilus sp.]